MEQISNRLITSINCTVDIIALHLVLGCYIQVSNEYVLLFLLLKHHHAASKYLTHDSVFFEVTSSSFISAIMTSAIQKIKSVFGVFEEEPTTTNRFWESFEESTTLSRTQVPFKLRHSWSFRSSVSMDFASALQRVSSFVLQSVIFKVKKTDIELV